jgi:hypothetical protein
MPSPSAPPVADRPNAPQVTPLLSGNRSFALCDGVPRVYRSERSPLSTDDLLTCIAANIAIDDKAFSAGFRQSVKVTRQTVDLFEGSEEMQTMNARLSDAEIARRAQNVLFDADISTRVTCTMHFWRDSKPSMATVALTRTRLELSWL